MNAIEIAFKGSTVDPKSGCWLWQGATAKGYARAYDPSTGKSVLVTRLVLGLTDRSVFACHHCDNTMCVNPAHLFTGSNADNQLDAVRRGRIPNSLKTHCSNGHPFSDANTYIRNARGHRTCRVCNRAAVAARKARLA